MKKTMTAAVLTAWFASGTAASAQIIESVGERALGMGGAFVGVATDSSATWWNPAALATGPFLDLALGRQVTTVTGKLPAERDQASWVAVATPPVGFSYYRFRVVQALDPTAQPRAHRQEEGTAVPLRSLAVNQLGVTLVHSLVSGVHVGTTLKYVHATPRAGLGEVARRASDLLDTGDDLSGGEARNSFDMDVGVVVAAGHLRVGGVVRNVRDLDVAADRDGAPFRIPRQVRAGAAFDAERTSSAIPLIVSLDADLQRYTVGAGDRRVVALGAERWLLARRLGIRGGA